MERIMLFDGVCNLCNGAVQFVIRNDSTNQVKFASLQSESAARLLEPFGVNPSNLQTFVLLEGGQMFTKSDAALRLARALRAPWAWLFPLVYVPRPIRDVVYDIVARNRYAWFGKQESCWVPTPELRVRFLP
jgi:predicted DCC family thiol-disulfide oxidoreductase YuxK